jgi:dephospho-CoA kinase
VAITGGIGSGKSAVAKLFEEWGAQIVDADILARKVVEPGSEGLRRIIENFPNDDLILLDESLNRPKLASIIFADSEKKKLLESLLHPLIRQLWLSEMEGLKKAGAPVIVYVVPLFFESTAKMVEIEKVILITAPEDLRIKRIMARDLFPREIAIARIQAQLPDSKKRDKSDYVIENDSTLEALREKSKGVFNDITSN